MLIQRDTNNWSFSLEEQNGLWHLLFNNDKNVITLFESVGITSTQENLFVGTKEECEQYIADNELLYTPINISHDNIKDIEIIENTYTEV
jgi:hypothetical protein